MQKSGGQNLDVAAVSGTSRARGRPRAFDREAALDTATRRFWRKGYAATSISDLTEAMGIGSPSLYAAFGSKDELYAESLRHFGERFEALVWGNFRAASTAYDAVAALLTDSAAAFTGSCGQNDPPGCMVTLSAVGSEGHVELGERVRAARAAAVTRIEQRLRQGLAGRRPSLNRFVPGARAVSRAAPPRSRRRRSFASPSSP